MEEKVEILSVSLLDRQRKHVRELKRLAASLGLEFGWHYLLDLTWILDRAGPVSGRTIMDAGAGIGIMQWYLAGHGARVLSVDRESRYSLPLRFRLRYRVRGLRAQDLKPLRKVIRRRPEDHTNLARWMMVEARDLGKAGASSILSRKKSRDGEIIIYNQDLGQLVDIPSNSVDLVIGVSSLEHNRPEDTGGVVAELMRVLKPGGALLATLGAAREEDWFHEPSQGWCYTEASLRRIFDLPAGTPSNYADYDLLFERLRNCDELRDNLASFYSKSGDKGMPWGIWDPKYQPVGVVKVKRDA